MTNHPSKRRSPQSGGLSLADSETGGRAITGSDRAARAAYGGDVRSPEVEPAPHEFVAVVDTLLAAGQSRTDVLFREVGRPTRLAPHGIALAASLERGDSELAAGRLVVLHDPAGQPAWNGVFRIACYARAALEPEMIADPMLAEVTWSWLEESLSERGAELTNLAGTVTTTASSRFGQIADEDATCEVELRCSWSPTWSPDDPVGVRAHLDAMCDLLTLMAGEPPPGDGIVSLSSRVR
jgi:hypothetical protein